MRYEYVVQNDGVHYATGLHRDETRDRLVWKCPPGQDTLVVRTRSDIAAADEIERVLEHLTRNDIRLGDRYTPIMSGVTVRMFPAAELSNGCPLNGEACAYTVFAVDYSDEGVCRVFAPADGMGMSRSSCLVPMDLGVRIEQVMQEQGYFSKRKTPTGYYRVMFDTSLDASYVDGDIRCEVGRYSIPLTGAAIARREVFIKTDTAPEIRSRNKGIRIVDYRRGR